MTRRVAELEAELEAASRLLKTYKAMLFGARSEKARIVLDGQGSLDLGDLSTVHVAPAANDDLMPKGKASCQAQHRRSAQASAPDHSRHRT
jgi:hypothetical protein